MDGLTALSLMMQARPTPVIMVSSLTAQGAAATFEALALGAVDYITKPGGTISLSIEDIRDQLLTKVKAAAKSRPRGPARPAPPAPPREATAPAVAQRRRPVGPIAAAQAAAGAAAAAAARPAGRALAGLVVVGVSTGGPRTLEDILPALPASLPWPVVVAQHMPANFTDAFARRMDRLCALTVREASATLPLEPGHAYIGQGGTDMVIAERLGRLVVQPRPESPDHPWHPSVDVLMDSARKLLPPDRLVGVLLTGMGDDGARAMAGLKAEGGRTIAESEETAVVFGMPAELIERGGASTVLPAHRVARQLCTWLGH
jgi:two-component system chemotaxis response regulator CheB